MLFEALQHCVEAFEVGCERSVFLQVEMDGWIAEQIVVDAGDKKYRRTSTSCQLNFVAGWLQQPLMLAAKIMFFCATAQRNHFRINQTSLIPACLEWELQCHETVALPLLYS